MKCVFLFLFSSIGITLVNIPFILECDLLKLFVSAVAILNLYSTLKSLICISVNLSDFCQGLLGFTQGGLSAGACLAFFSPPLYQAMRYVGKATNQGLRVAGNIKGDCLRHSLIWIFDRP